MGVSVNTSFGVLIFFALIVGCDESESPSTVPFIKPVDFSFLDGADNTPDTLKLTFEYTDGDSDLGFNYNDEAHRMYPYHYGSFYQGKDGSMIEVIPTSDIPALKLDIDASIGKLLFPRSRKDPYYSKLLPPFSCVNYQGVNFLIPADEANALDQYSQVAETFSIDGKTYYLVTDTLYVRHNPNHYNIKVDFLVEQPDGSFVEFDWTSRTCTTFDGRFPVLYGDHRRYVVKYGPFRAETYLRTRGKMTYLLQSHGFKIVFGGKRIKLRFSIKDRALNVSNVAETELLQL
jgi:hypothetical protein